MDMQKTRCVRAIDAIQGSAGRCSRSLHCCRKGRTGWQAPHLPPGWDLAPSARRAPSTSDWSCEGAESDRTGSGSEWWRSAARGLSVISRRGLRALTGVTTSASTTASSSSCGRGNLLGLFVVLEFCVACTACSLQITSECDLVAASCRLYGPLLKRRGDSATPGTHHLGGGQRVFGARAGVGRLLQRRFRRHRAAAAAAAASCPAASAAGVHRHSRRAVRRWHSHPQHRIHRLCIAAACCRACTPGAWQEPQLAGGSSACVQLSRTTGSECVCTDLGRRV